MRTIKSHQDFERVFTQGRRVNHPLIRMVISDCVSEGDPARVAFAAAKRLGNAVVRNRSKRVLRETARRCGLPVAGREIILFATPRTRTAPPEELDAALRGLLARAGVAPSDPAGMPAQVSLPSDVSANNDDGFARGCRG